jgi:phospholipid-translocating ATPase
VAHTKPLFPFFRKMNYQASSPDEIALVEACARLGFIYLSDNNEILAIRVRVERRRLKVGETPESEKMIYFKRLAVLEFTSDRKRMSVIVMDKDGQIWLYTKGAESHVLPLCKNRSDQLVMRTQQHINDFAKDGLRTLAVARRKLTKLEFINFSNDLIEASSSLTDRVEKMEVVHRKIESGLELLGATAVEDACKLTGHFKFNH